MRGTLMTGLHDALEGADVDAAVFALRPDYRVLLVSAEGLQPGPSDATSEQLIDTAERWARETLATTKVEELPHIHAWREAYRSFGAKPQRTRNSVEALTRRAESGLPRVNRLTDIYNAISVLRQIPIGGEDLDHYDGPPRLLRAAGTESFDTTAGGEAATEHPEVGEVIWMDDTAVTCRRWNWRQGRRTQLTDATTTAVFLLDALEPVSDDDLTAAGHELISHLTTLGPDVRTATRMIRAQ
jgi:DNA/RNA-binding domain of Phe-tRNA-synthetase-like protein